MHRTYYTHVTSTSHIGHCEDPIFGKVLDLSFLSFKRLSNLNYRCLGVVQMPIQREIRSTHLMREETMDPHWLCAIARDDRERNILLRPDQFAHSERLPLIL
jgi:hypothetical protein